jgi:hypothetical protein
VPVTGETTAETGSTFTRPSWSMSNAMSKEPAASRRTTVACGSSTPDGYAEGEPVMAQTSKVASMFGVLAVISNGSSQAVAMVTAAKAASHTERRRGEREEASVFTRGKLMGRRAMRQANVA